MRSTEQLRPCLRLGLLLAVALAVAGTARTARADEDLDEVKRRLKLEADELEAKVKARVEEADKVGKTNPKEAIDLLSSLETTLETTKALTPERKQVLQQFLAGRVKHYRQAIARGPGGGIEDRGGAPLTRQREIEAKNDDQKRMLQQTSELMRQGKYKEANAVGDRWRQKYPTSPGAAGFDRISRAGGALREMQGIRDQRSAKFQSAWKEFYASMIPIEGDIEFPSPEKWRRITKMRQQFTLTEKEQKLLKALQTPITETFKALPLEGVIETFEKRYGVSINVDRQGLEAAGLTMESPVSINVREKSLRSTLKNMLGDVGLTYAIVNGELRVTTPELASKITAVRPYYIGDLIAGLNFNLDPYTSQVQMVQSVASLIKMIEGIDPAAWQSGGGPGLITFNPVQGLLMIRASAEMHFTLQGTLR